MDRGPVAWLTGRQGRRHRCTGRKELADASVLGHFLTKVMALGLRQVTSHTTHIPNASSQRVRETVNGTLWRQGQRPPALSAPFPVPWLGVSPPDTESVLTHTWPLNGGARGWVPAPSPSRPLVLAWDTELFACLGLEYPCGWSRPSASGREASSSPPASQAIGKYLEMDRHPVQGTYTPVGISQRPTFLLTITVRSDSPKVIA